MRFPCDTLKSAMHASCVSFPTEGPGSTLFEIFVVAFVVTAAFDMASSTAREGVGAGSNR